jgi:hypothetical protein
MWIDLARRNGSSRSTCSTCVQLELTAEKFIVGDNLEVPIIKIDPGRLRRGYMNKMFSISSGWTKMPLGTFAEIQTKSELCPFCRLVVQSVQAHPNCRNTRNNESAICFASWEIDGRKVVRDAEGDITARRARTRRIHLHWPGNEHQDSYIVLVAPTAWGSQGMFFGRAIGTARDNPLLARRWLELCHESHGSRCLVERGQSFEDMRRKAFFGVIDVDLMHLTSLPINGRYVIVAWL